MKTLDGGRIGIASQALGIAQGALDAAVTYAKERKQFDTPIASFQGVQFQLADMATQIEAARLLVYNAAYRASAGLSYSQESAMAKLYGQRNGHAGYHPGGPDPRRLWLYPGIPGRADDAGCQDHRNLRRDQ